MLKPTKGKVVIKPIDRTTTESGINLINDDTKYGEGEVMASLNEEIPEGSVVLYSLAYDEVTFGEETYHLSREEDVFAVIEP